MWPLWDGKGAGMRCCWKKKSNGGLFGIIVRVTSIPLMAEMVEYGFIYLFFDNWGPP